MTNEEIVRILTLHNGCLSAQENGECRYNHLGRCEPCRYFTDDEEFTEAESAAIEALKERKTGKWIVEEIGLRRYVTKCSVCGTVLHEGYNFDNAQEYKEYIDGLGRYDKFCHECGAKMEVDE